MTDESAKLDAPDVAKDSGLDLELDAPGGLVAHRFDVGGDAFAILEFPLADLVSPQLLASLSASEQSVMRLVLEGKSNLEIARVRRRAVRTVANQVASIFRKLGIGSRCELYALAARGKKA
jgi:DNA-binding CsgD family transcriptional regulator